MALVVDLSTSPAPLRRKPNHPISSDSSTHPPIAKQVKERGAGFHLRT